ncbi:MAG: hypothetical protein K6T75_02785 [Acetobacteraceae bacterium]|nr:hypothetical protein [Acetobacteraceae bacterium]
MAEALRLQRFTMVDLSPHFNNKGLTLPENREEGDLRGLGDSLPAEDLPPAGVFENCGVPFLMPDARWPRDNLELEGQELPLPRGRWARAHFLGTSDLASFEAEVAVVYAGGPPEPKRLGFSAFNSVAAPVYGERPGPTARRLRTRYKDTPMDLRLWHQTLELDASRELLALRFEDLPVLHVFAITLEGPGEDGGEGP